MKVCSEYSKIKPGEDRPNCNKIAVVYKSNYERPLCAVCYKFLVIEPYKKRRIPTK